jgi:hypothetical protein
MPVKRRVGKARQFDDSKRQQLLEGPDACLFAGEGYLHSISVGSFALASPEEQASVLEAMRADWARFGAEMMEHWRAGEPEPIERPCVLPRLGSPDSLPWAAEQFGEPGEA